MKLVNCKEEEFVKELSASKTRIICFGTAQMTEQALEIPIVEERLVYFVDNDKEKQNKLFRFKDKEYKVVSAEILSTEDMQDKIILIASSYFIEIQQQLDKIPNLDNASCYIWPKMHLNYAPDDELFFQRRILDAALTEYSTVLDSKGISAEEKTQKLKEKSAYISGTSPEDRPLVLPRVMILPTTRCNLRCKDCSSLFPYFKNPKSLELEKLIADLKTFLSGIDECIRITVGGEPFLYRDISQLLEFLIQEDKFLGILLITNGTIVPKPEMAELLKSDKILVQISDYGKIEEMSRVVRFFEEHDITFEVLSDQSWIDMGNTEFRGKNEENRKLEYLNCEQSVLMKSIHDGQMFGCARSARMFALGAYESKIDYFDLHNSDDSVSIREKIKSLYYRDTADSCNHCDCGKFPTKIIPAAIQVDGYEYKFSKYTIVKREEYEKIKKRASLIKE